MTDIINPIDLQSKLTHMRFDEWLNDDLFRIRWWAMLLLFVLDIWLWWKVVNRTRLAEIVLYAAITSVMILILDEIGEEITLWDYPTDLFPLFPPIAAINLACLPFLYSVVYQIFGSWKTYTIVQAVMAAFSCFVFEPIFVWLGMYQMITWKSWYGLPLYFAIGMIAKGALSLINRIKAKYPGQLQL